MEEKKDLTENTTINAKPRELTNEELETIVGGAPRFRYPGHYHPAGTIGDQKYMLTDYYDPCVGMIIEENGVRYICTELLYQTSGPVGHERTILVGLRLANYQDRNISALLSCISKTPGDGTEYLIVGFE